MRGLVVAFLASLALVACNNEVKVTYPPAQTVFLNGLDERAGLFRSAPNEIQKSAFFRETLEWTEAYAKMRGTTITNWKGKIKRLRTDHGGETVDVVFSVKLSSADVEFYHIALPFTPGIKRGSPVYSQLTDRKEGELVCFSGIFERDTKKGFVETSLTERGRMTNPEFKITVTSVTKCDA